MRQGLRGSKRSIRRYRHHLVDVTLVDGLLGDQRNEIRCPALDHVRGPGRVAAAGRAIFSALLRATIREQRGAIRLGGDDLRFWSLRTEHTGHTRHGAPGAITGDKVIELLALKGIHDLARRGALMNISIGGVFKLSGHEPAIGFCQFPALGDHAHTFFFLGRQNDLGTEKAHQLAALNREGLHHHRDKRVALGRAHHRQANTGVTGGRLDHGLPGL